MTASKASELPERLRQTALLESGGYASVHMLMNEAAAAIEAATARAAEAERERDALRDERDNLLGINAAWARDYAGEKERGDAWMKDCKAAELDAERLREQFQAIVDFDLKQCAADFGKDDVDHQFRLWVQNRALAMLPLRRSAP